MTGTTRTVAQRLSDHLVALDYRALSSDVVAKAKDSVLDQLGCQLIGSTMSWNTAIHEVVRGFAGREEATVVNHGSRTSAHDAAFVNAAFGQGCELDDGLRDSRGRTCGHPGAMTVPVALALGESRHLSGERAIAAIVAGYETAFRLGQAMPGAFERGWHNQSLIGPFASAAVAARLLDLDGTRTAHALAIAGSHASGTMEYDQTGGEVKRMHAGLAVRAGIQSAMFAKAGLTGPLSIFEGKRGIFHCFGGDDDLGAADAMVDGFGKDFGVLRAGHKTLPVAATIQSPILLFAEIVRDNGVTADDVERIDVGLALNGLMHGAAIQTPRDTIGAQFSLAFSLAIRLLKGSNDLRLYADPALWRDPEVARIAETVHAHADARFSGDKDRGSHVKVTLTDGRCFERMEEYAKGVPGNPLTHDELVDKFRRLAASVLSPDRAEEVLHSVARLDQLDDVGTLVALLRRAA